MKKTMVFENETAYDNWFDVNEEKEGGHDFLENRVVIIKETRTINGKKFNGFLADSTIECKNVRTAIRRFVKELNSNGFEVSVDELEGSCNGVNLNDLTGSGMVVEIEEIDDDRYYVNYMCYQDEVEEETTETATDSETTEAEESPEVGNFVYDVVIHNFYGCDTYTVRADGLESAKDKALKIMKDESLDEDYYSIDSIRIYEENSDELLKEIIFETTETKDTTEKELEKLEKELIESEDTHIEDIKKFKEKSELNKNYAVITDEKFHQLTKTLIKSLFKAIGIQDTRKIHFTIANDIVFFNYNGTQYKYYPSQCKVFKKCDRKYQRINWKDFAEENNSDGQKHKRGRSPPLLLI